MLSDVAAKRILLGVLIAAAMTSSPSDADDDGKQAQAAASTDQLAPSAPPPQQAASVAPPPAADSSGSTTSLETVVVTAAKRSQSAQSVPGAVSVITGAALQKINASNFQDFATYIPGVSSSSEGTGENQVNVRGITTGPQASATVGILVDETPIGSSASYAIGSNALDFNVFDLDRLELLSGPQGTLYGASTLGGLLKYVTQAPNLHSYEEIVEGEGAYTQNPGGWGRAIRTAINVPVIDGRLGIRVDGFTIKDAGFIDNPTLGLKHVDAANSLGGRISMLAKFTPEISFRLSAIRQGVDRDGSTNTDRDPQTHQPVEGKYEQSTQVREPFTQQLSLYSGVLNWDLGWSTLTSASSWQYLLADVYVDETRLIGGDLGTGNLIPFGAPSNNYTKKFVQEVRLASPSSKSFEWMVGAYLTNEHSSDYTAVVEPTTSNGDLLGLVPIFSGDLPTHYGEYAGFANTTIYFTQHFDLGLGYRYSVAKQSYSQIFQGLLENELDPFAVDTASARTKDEVRTYLINPRYQFNKDVQAYGRVASGWRPGGPNFTFSPINSLLTGLKGVPNGPPTFKPDTVWNYELGEKGKFLHGKALLNFDVYYIDWRNIQIVTNASGANQLENAGRAKVYGAELSGSYLVMRGLTVGGSMSAANATLAQDVAGLQAKAGARLPLSPRLNAALFSDYRIPLTDGLNGTAGLSARFVGNRNAGFEGSTVKPNYVLHSYPLLDLRCGLQSENVNLGIFVKNVFNEIGEVAADTTADEYVSTAPVRVTVTQPRTVGLVLTFDYEQ